MGREGKGNILYLSTLDPSLRARGALEGEVRGLKVIFFSYILKRKKKTRNPQDILLAPAAFVPSEIVSSPRLFNISFVHHFPFLYLLLKDLEEGGGR